MQLMRVKAKIQKERRFFRKERLGRQGEGFTLHVREHCGCTELGPGMDMGQLAIYKLGPAGRSSWMTLQEATDFLFRKK